MRNLEKFVSLCGSVADGLLLTSVFSRHYAAESGIAEGVAVVSKAGCRYFTDSRYIEAAEKQLKGFEVQMVDAQHGYISRLNDAIRDFGLKTLGVEERYLTLAEYNSYHETLNAELVCAQEPISRLRWSKEDWELEKMLKAQEITDETFTQLLEVIHPGMTEKELTAELIYRLLRNGADGLSFNPIVVSGPNTSMPHGVPSERVIQAGDFVTMDFGCLFDGYCSDMTRTVAVGFATDKMREVYDIVAKAQLAGIAASKAGVLGCDVDGAARKVITDAGYGPYFGHGYGHSLGLEIHEAPNANPSGKEPMPLHAVTSAEPGIYLPGEFGVRIEDVVIFQEDHAQVITKSPKQLIIL